jgi:MFS family permease
MPDGEIALREQTTVLRARDSRRLWISGCLLLITGGLFERSALSAVTHTWLWSASFFFASAAASSGYLSVSELFPLELRALAIALFYAVGTGTGGLFAPTLFGALIASHDRTDVFLGYAFASALMICAGLLALRLSVAAEGRALEDVAAPLSSVMKDAASGV